MSAKMMSLSAFGAAEIAVSKSLQNFSLVKSLLVIVGTYAHMNVADLPPVSRARAEISLSFMATVKLSIESATVFVIISVTPCSCFSPSPSPDQKSMYFDVRS